MGQILTVDSSLSSSFVLVYAGAESKSKVLHSCHHWKSHILTITFNCLGKYLKHLLCKNCTPDKVGFYRRKRSRPYSCPPHSLSPLSLQQLFNSHSIVKFFTKALTAEWDILLRELCHSPSRCWKFSHFSHRQPRTFRSLENLMCFGTSR